MKLLKVEVNYATVSKCFIQLHKVELEVKREAPVLVVYYYSEYFPEKIQRIHKLVIITRNKDLAKMITCFFVPATCSYEEYVKSMRCLQAVSILELFDVLMKKVPHFRSVMHIYKSPYIERAYLILFPPS